MPGAAAEGVDESHVAIRRNAKTEARKTYITS